MTKPSTRPVELPCVVTARLAEPQFRELVTLAESSRRTLSQVVRLLLESAIRDNRSVVQ
jgi:hypothetical protein